MAENQTHGDLADHEQDPSASTQMFRAFVSEGQTEATRAPKVSGRALAIVAVAVVVIAVIAALLLR
jgi:hypothetical protein